VDLGVTKKIEEIQQLFVGQSYLVMFLLGSVILVLWFLPAILAAFLNRKHFRKILVACVPAGISFIAWFALIGWAVTGKVIEKYKDRNTDSVT